MRLGIALPIGRGEEPSGDVVSRDARAAEEAGFDSVWFFDSIGRGRMSLDPLIGVSVAAAASTRLEVGIGILQVPLRNPVELAHRVLSAQMVCEGRLLLGVGAGSTRGDFEALGLDFDSRMRALHEGLATMRRLWDGEEYAGANLSPLSEVRGGPPVLIGSWTSERWISRAAREFDGWIASAAFTGFDSLAAGIKGYREAGREAGGRDEHIGGPGGGRAAGRGECAVPPARHPQGRRRAAAAPGGAGLRRRGGGAPGAR